MAKAKMDAVALLKADHRKVEDPFEKYEKSRGKKADIAKKICMELMVHTMLEEELFYPACREAGQPARMWQLLQSVPIGWITSSM